MTEQETIAAGKGTLDPIVRNVLLAPWRGLWMAVWDFCEWQRIPLGRMAPWVFNQMIGCYRCKPVANAPHEPRRDSGVVLDGVVGTGKGEA